MSNWRDRAACLSLNGELFFPHAADNSRAWGVAAKAVCHTCPVIADCLTWALDTRERYGVWGGTDSDERANILRSHARKTKREAAATFQGSRLDDIVLLLADGVAPEDVARRLSSSVGAIAQCAYRAGECEIARVFYRARRVVRARAREATT